MLRINDKVISSLIILLIDNMILVDVLDIVLSRFLFFLVIRQESFFLPLAKNLAWSSRWKESCLIDQDNKNLERITRYLKFLVIQASFFLFLLKDSYLIFKINSAWCFCPYIYIYIYTTVWTLIIYFYKPAVSNYCVHFNEQKIFFSYIRPVRFSHFFIMTNLLSFISIIKLFFLFFIIYHCKYSGYFFCA